MRMVFYKFILLLFICTLSIILSVGFPAQQNYNDSDKELLRSNSNLRAAEVTVEEYLRRREALLDVSSNFIEINPRLILCITI